MISMFSKLFATALITLVTATASAQALNPRWHGTWKSSEDSLVISEKTVKIGKESCAWSTARPQQITGCMAFYDGTISKAQLMSQFEKVEKAAKDMTKDANFKQAQKDRIHDSMEKNRQVLAGISSDTFKMVHTSTDSKVKGSGGCASFYFLDQQAVYFVLNCAPAPEAYTVRPYKKAP
jgi:hypothetical protein